jgi:hypothetical protein
MRSRVSSGSRYSVTNVVIFTPRTCDHQLPARSAPSRAVPHREHCAGGGTSSRSSGSGSRDSPAPTWSRWCSSSGSRSGARMAGASGSLQRESSPAKFVYEDLARDRLAAANAVLEFLRLPQLDADDLPLHKQADSRTETYVDLARPAMSSPG